MATQNDNNEPDQDGRFEESVYNIDLGKKSEVDFDAVECTPEMHVGRPAFIFVIGPQEEDVRKQQVCTNCQMAFQEEAFTDVHALSLESEGQGGLGRVTSHEDSEFVKIPYPDSLDEAAKEAGMDEYTVCGAGYNDGEMLLKITEDEDADDESE